MTGALHEDLEVAAKLAMQVDPAACRRHALENSWDAATRQFLGNLAPVRSVGSVIPEGVASNREA